MKNFVSRRWITFVALSALATMLAVSAPSQAADRGGHNFGGGRSEGGHFEGREGGHFEGHHFEGHERRDFDGHRRFGFGFGFGPTYPYYAPYSAPGYWYYCPSYNGYYPNVASCPEAWVPYPAQ